LSTQVAEPEPPQTTELPGKRQAPVSAEQSVAPQGGVTFEQATLQQCPLPSTPQTPEAHLLFALQGPSCVGEPPEPVPSPPVVGPAPVLAESVRPVPVLATSGATVRQHPARPRSAARRFGPRRWIKTGSSGPRIQEPGQASHRLEPTQRGSATAWPGTAAGSGRTSCRSARLHRMA